MAVVKRTPGSTRSDGSPAGTLVGISGNGAGLTLADSDFISDDDDIKWQCNSLIFGDGGNGKTTFATRYAPQPVALINFDNRARHAVKKARDLGRVIHNMHVDYPANITRQSSATAQQFGRAAVDKVIKNFEIAVEESRRGNVRTICLDTGTEYNEILTLAIRGTLDKIKGDYGRSKDLINREWWRLFNLAREGNAHFVVLARARAIWVDNEPTGRFTFRGPDVLNDAVDWAGQIRLKQGRRGKLLQKFELEITKAGVNIEQLGEVYNDELWESMGGPFVCACMLQYEGSDQEDWE